VGSPAPETPPAFLAQHAAARWARAASRSTVLAAGLGAILAVGVLDWGVALIAGYDFTVTVLYILPVGFVGWAAGRAAGMLVAFPASIVELGATFAANRATRPSVALVSCALELLVFLGAAHTMALLRDHIEYERRTSLTDALTGIANRRGFRKAAELALAWAGRQPAALSLAYMDLDEFKEVNDTLGHAAGDELLRLVGRTLAGSVRSTDVVARLGGDEFAILLPATDVSTSRVVVERLCERLRAAMRSEAAAPAATFSMGVATFPPPAPGSPPPASVEALLRTADAAMYEVKRAGKGDVRYTVVEAAGERR
jgi:diguanylate cyclase (GGDEF)-like protein